MSDCEHNIMLPDYGNPLCRKCDQSFETKDLLEELTRIKAENNTLRNWVNDSGTNENLRDTILLLANQRDTLQARIAELETACIHARFYIDGLADDAYEVDNALAAAGYTGVKR